MLSCNEENVMKVSMKAIIRSHFESYSATIKAIKRNTTILIVCNTLIAIGNGLTAPLFTRYLEELGATPSIIGYILGGNSLLLFVTLIGGYLADMFGRKKIIVASYLILSLSIPWFIVADTWIWAVPGIILLGARTLSEPGIDALLADETTSDERGKVYSIMWVLITSTTILSSSMLAFITSAMGLYQGVRSGFMVYFILAIITVFLFNYYLEDKKPLPCSSPNFIHFHESLWKTARASSRDYRLFFAYYLAETPARMILSTYYVLFLVHVSKASDALAAMVFSIAMVIYLVSQIAIGPLIDKVDRAHALSSFLILTLLSTMFFNVFNNNLLIVAFFCVIMLVTIFLEQYMHLIFMADVTVEENRGTSLGLMQTVIGIESALSIVVGGMLFEIDPFYPFILSVLFLMISLIILGNFSKRPHITTQYT